MGITIHYKLQFTGNGKQVVAKLKRIAEIARGLAFKEVGPLWQVDYATDYDTPDKFTPMVTNEQGESIIKPEYRWAKIQYEPSHPILRDASEFEEYERKVIARQEQLSHLTGYVQHLWFGDGCEPTNIGLIHNGKSKTWTGSAFTKTHYSDDAIKAHVTICVFLKLLGKLNLKVTVDDESGFWDTWDVTSLLSSDLTGLKNLKRVLLDLKMLTQKYHLPLKG